MAKIILSTDLQRYTDGTRELEVAATRYLDLVVELRQRFPALPEAIITKHAIAIDGVIIQTPLLETFTTNSELVFVTRIAGG